MGFTITPLPGYSPDLNPIEGLWKWMREDVTKTHCYATMRQLFLACKAFIDRINAGDEAYLVAGDKLELLDRDGNPIESTLSYTLESVKASLPTTPIAMRGMYFYMADAATFTDCATGQRLAVANNAQLERDYAAAQGSSSQPILLVVEGHFTLEPNPDTGAMVKTLATDKAGTFSPGKDCTSVK